MAKSLKPILGPYASVAFFAGLWGATVSTIMPTFQAGAYFIADFFKFPMKASDPKFRTAILTGILLSLLGPFLKGAFFPLLIVMLALGLCGTPFILVLLLLLLNTHRPTPGFSIRNRWITLLGTITTGIALFLAIRFILSIMEKHL